MVISIVAILSISSIVGFGYLGDILRAREATGVLSDLIKQGELKVLRGDFEKAVINFFPYYVVIEEQLEGANLDFGLGAACGDEDEINNQDKHKIETKVGGNLIQKDGEGVVMQIKSVEADSECIEFKNSEEVEWNYQLTDGDQFSKIIRFVHFNLKREDPSNLISIVEGDGSKIEITAPYGKKLIYSDYKSPTSLIDSLIIKVEDESKNSSDTLTIQ